MKTFTLKIKSLPTNAKLIPHGIIDHAQKLKNNKFNLETAKITKKIQKDFPKASITWCLDGCIVITTNKNDLESENVFKNHKWDIQTSKSNIIHKKRSNW